MKTQPYLFFEGRCEEAIEFCRGALGAEVTALMRSEHSPEPSVRLPGAEDKIIHASLRIGDLTVMASEGRCRGDPNSQGFSPTLTVPDGAAADRLVSALADGGQVQMPLSKIFFPPGFGMVSDRFGVSWMIVVEA